MLEGLILVEGAGVSSEALRALSLANTLQLVVGTVPGGGVILHLAASSGKDLNAALTDFAGVAGVTAVRILTLKNAG